MARKRSVANELISLLQTSPRPVYVLDERRRIVFCNDACCAWLGTSSEQLIGKQCNYRGSLAAPGDLTAALCPPPEVFAGESVDTQVVCLDAGSKVSRRVARFSPLGTGSLEPVGAIAIVETTESLQHSVSDSLADEALHQRLQSLALSLRIPFRTERLVGESPAIARVRDQVGLAVAGQGCVAIRGIVGSGCEKIARIIHSGGDPNTAGPLMPLTCDLMTADLLQTTVMAFLRRCIDADTRPFGTLLLLEVDKLSLDAQLEMMAFFQLPIFKLRTIVTSQRRLLDLAHEEQFHLPLALALSTLEIALPPLAERRQDIPFLAQQFVEDANAAGARQLNGLTTEALDQLCALPWQGDLDELAEVIQQACQAADGPRIEVEDLPKRVALLTSAAAHPPVPEETIRMDDFLAEIESELIRRALERAQGNKAKAARLLGVNRARLLRKLDQAGQPQPAEAEKSDPQPE
jgi:DNA-binding NtrC family response regulator